MSNYWSKSWFKTLAAVLLFFASYNQPYGYYQILRWAILLIAGYTAHLYYEKKSIGWAWIFGIMALLFNPIIPFYFSRDTWQFIDSIAMIVFAVSLFGDIWKKDSNY